VPSTALKNGGVARKHVVTVFQNDRPVSYAGLLGGEDCAGGTRGGGAAGEAFAIINPGPAIEKPLMLSGRTANCSNDCDHSRHKPPMAARGRLDPRCRRYSSGLTRLGRVGGQNGTATREIEIDLRPQADGEAEVGTG
jgi:hypothetical protein